MLRMVHLRLQVVHADHFQEVSSHRSSDGSIGVTGPFEYVLVLVGQHRSVRFTYGDALCMVVEVHVLVQCLVGHV